MYKLIFPSRDTTLYQQHPTINTGVDQIIELTKINSGSAVDDLTGQYEYYTTSSNSRILMDFNITSISQSLASAGVSNPTFYLTLKATEAKHLPIAYTLYAHAISGSWTNGTGYYNLDNRVKNGASWRYRHSQLDGQQWDSQGGDYYTGSGYTASQSFSYEDPDVRMDVTTIIRQWLSGSIAQQGLIIKHSDDNEDNDSDMGSIKFFSKDTHTIYVPRLEVFWDSVDVSGTGSISQITGEEYVIYLKNLRDSYKESEYAKIRMGVRQRYPQKTYSTSSAYLTTNRLPYNSYYQVMDSATDEVIVPFDDNGTRVNCDTSGNYILLDMDSFLPERYYRIVFKVVNGDIINYYDDNYSFKVHRR